MILARDTAKKWQNCRRCKLAKFRRNVVWGEGPLPADVLFIGEGPGRSEDLLKRPFIGPSGALLRKALASVMKAPALALG